MTNTIDAKILAKMFLAGAKNLESKKEWINDLNVFPVPDGDTGTNMTLTIMSAARDVASMEEPDMRSLCKAISSGSLRGQEAIRGLSYPNYSAASPNPFGINRNWTSLFLLMP